MRVEKAGAPAGATERATTSPALQVRPIDESEYIAHFAAHTGASYQQTPEWAAVRRGDWEPEFVGWFDADGGCAGIAVIRYRRLPGTSFRLAYIPAGPLLDWSDASLRSALDALRDHLDERRVFVVRMYPPVDSRTWSSGRVRRAVGESSMQHLSEVTPDTTNAVADEVREVLHSGGWAPMRTEEDVESTQPCFLYSVPLDGLNEDEVFSRMSKDWRKNIRAAQKRGVEVRPAAHEDLPTVHRLHVETSRRNGFTPLPLTFFETVWDEFEQHRSGSARFDLASVEEEVISGTLMLAVAGRDYGLVAGNSVHHREARPSNAIHWVRIRSAITDGAGALDLGAVPPVLTASHPSAGLLHFKLGLGGEIAENIGGWQLVLRPGVDRVFRTVYSLYREAPRLARVLRPGGGATSRASD
ncbi:lipid II:glycine glycyltransferase FemX [Brachybacterium endophyticum]|nr:peptidoglycan bridge formation glycyltransferase FemA/FemB family protein [Brachybacterium endophyticum]